MDGLSVDINCIIALLVGKTQHKLFFIIILSLLDEMNFV